MWGKKWRARSADAVSCQDYLVWVLAQRNVSTKRWWIDWYWWGKPESLGKYPGWVAHFLPQVPHWLDRDRTRASRRRDTTIRPLLWHYTGCIKMIGAVLICNYGFQNARRSKFPTWNETAGVQVLCACAIPLPSSLSVCNVTKR